MLILDIDLIITDPFAGCNIKLLPFDNSAFLPIQFNKLQTLHSLRLKRFHCFVAISMALFAVAADDLMDSLNNSM